MNEKRTALGLNSVRGRLVLLNVGVLALTLLMLGYAVHYSIQVSLFHEVDAGLNRFALRLQSNFADGLPPPPPGAKQPQSMAQGTKVSKNDRFGQFGPRVYDLHGRSIMPPNAGVAWDEASLAKAESGENVLVTRVIGGEKVRIVSVPLIESGKITGAIQIGRPLSDVIDQINRVTTTLLTLAPIALAFAALGGMFLVGRALRPIRLITEAAESIEAQNLSGRLDVTGHDEFSHLADTLNGMLARLHKTFGDLEQAYEQQQRFTADASHELRTPLSIIKANASLALSSERPAKDYRRALQAIDDAADRSNAIIRDLLLIARTDAGHSDMSMVECPLDRCIAAASEIVEEPDGASIRLALADEHVTILCDLDSLTRVFVNLLQNALRHTPPDGSITITTSRDEQRVYVKVKDTGEGIEAEHLPHIFERFYRADPSRSRGQGGTGLGLSICKLIVEAHKGTIGIESEYGRGTTVTVALPYVMAAQALRGRAFSAVSNS